MVNSEVNYFFFALNLPHCFSPNIPIVEKDPDGGDDDDSDGNAEAIFESYRHFSIIILICFLIIIIIMFLRHFQQKHFKQLQFLFFKKSNYFLF